MRSSMCVLFVLLAGGAEAQRPLFTLLAAQAARVAAWDTCSTFEQIYPSGKELCERMWGDSFEYTPDEERAYTMWWFDPDNPNDKIAENIGVEKPEMCMLQYFHKSEGSGPGEYSTGVYTAPSPEGDEFTECLPWKEESCCHQAVVSSPKAMNEAYGEGYQWNRCDYWESGYKMSQACERFFVQEACMYECSPHAGAYRRYKDDEVYAYWAWMNITGNADPYGRVTLADTQYQGTFTYGGKTYNNSLFFGNGVYGPNQWQMYKMPIKASYCDAMYETCRLDFFCGSGDFWACRADYREQEIARVLEPYDQTIQDAVKAHNPTSPEQAIAMAEEQLMAQAAAEAAEAEAEAALEAARKSKEEALAQAQKDKDKAVDKAEDELPTWAWVMIGALIIITLLIVGFVLYIYNMEKRTGKPIFVNLAEPSGLKKGTSASAVAA